jgi:hypothetical protein
MSHRQHPNIDLLDKSFQENAVSSFMLTLELTDFHFSYAIFKSSNNKFIGLGKHPLPVKDGLSHQAALGKVLHEHPLLTKSFKNVLLSYGGKQNTLIPHALFDRIAARKYLAYNHPVSENHAVLSDTLKNTPAHNVYSLPAELEDLLHQSWPNLAIRHLSTVLIETLGIHFKHIAGDNMVFVHVREDCFDMIHFKNSRLYFYNLFPFRSREDFIYFLLAAIEQLGLNPESVQLYISGRLTKESQLFDMIYRYIRHSDFIGNNNAFDYAHVLDELNLYEFYSLFSILQCVS